MNLLHFTSFARNPEQRNSNVTKDVCHCLVSGEICYNALYTTWRARWQTTNTTRGKS
jgi:hypothetical protein